MHAQQILKFGACKQRGEAQGINLEQIALQQLCTNHLCPKRGDVKCCTWWGRRDEHLSFSSPVSPLGVRWPPLAEVGRCEGLHPVCRPAGSPLPCIRGHYVPPHHHAAQGRHRDARAAPELPHHEFTHLVWLDHVNPPHTGNVHLHNTLLGFQSV